MTEMEILILLQITGDKERDDVNIRTLEKQYEITYSNFNQRFPIYGSFRHISTATHSPQKQRPSDYLRQLIENPDSKIRHSLQNLCSQQTKLKTAYNCSKKLLSAIKTNLSRDITKKELKLIEFSDHYVSIK